MEETSADPLQSGFGRKSAFEEETVLIFRLKSTPKSAGNLFALVARVRSSRLRPTPPKSRHEREKHV